MSKLADGATLRRVFACIRGERTCPKWISARIGVNRSTVSEYCRLLQSRGQVREVGRDQEGVWYVRV